MNNVFVLQLVVFSELNIEQLLFNLSIYLTLWNDVVII